MHPVRIPHEQVNDESVLLVEWLAPDGLEVKSGQPVAMIETSKATTEVVAPQAGYLRHAAVKGTELPVGAVFCFLAGSPTELIPVEKASAPPIIPESVEASLPVAIPPVVSSSVPNSTASETRFSRGALALMAQHELTEEQFKGKGMIRERDILAFLGPNNNSDRASKPSAAADEGPLPPPPLSAPIPAAGVPIRTEDLPRMKRIEAKYLSSGLHHTLASVVTIMCPTSGLKAAASQHPELGGNASAIIIFETARLLRKYPVFNAFYDHGKINYYEQVNIGLAVDGGRGLKVPVLVQADKKGIVELAREVEGLLLGYLNDELPVAVLAGGTFTITDLSGEGVLFFHPLINQGQAAILGVGSEHSLPGATDSFFNLILAFDHQLTEGRMAAAFLRDLRDRVVSYEEALRPGATTAGKEPICSQCLRSATELVRLKVPLLQTVQPDGAKAFICRLCLIGS
jgi:pyruvate/2-oxoglutarate dehydrogenase complex dihydrolipoamide acyltransferase (E2) component